VCCWTCCGEAVAASRCSCKTNISATTTKDHLHDFFTFCGTITSIDYNEVAHTANIHFEKPSAAKTALMLNGGTLDGSALNVTSEIVHPDHDDDHTVHDGTVRQEDKPRAGIAAEYLSKGYVLSDGILQRAIDLDTKHGISTHFLSYFNSIDQTVGSKVLGENKTISGKVTELAGQGYGQAKAIDEHRGISKHAGDYYSKAVASPFGQKVVSFYTTTTKQVLDIHEEARRIADSSKPTATATVAPVEPPTTAPPAGV